MQERNCVVCISHGVSFQLVYMQFLDLAEQFVKPSEVEFYCPDDRVKTNVRMSP